MALRISLKEETYKDKVLGCWFGKNAGGTLGGPVEQAFGQDAPFDLWWYPKLEPGGLPNDDLELQLIWLQALEERGPFITARDLADYWLECVVYNWDEYGFHKTNLRKGLLPPVSGWYNNYFKNHMGCPIRSEIWACLAPGVPDLAAKLAYEDAICDHAGGESVYGEIFNVTLESAAFVESDRDKLLDLGMAALPEGCATWKAVKAARDAFAAGLDWKEARRKVMEVAFDPVAQYSPINMGFQTIGWLYGKDFGEAICIAVNCGWDTDCTGATLGALLGIIHGYSGLPQKWLEPLGEEVTTSEANGGIRHVRAPKNLRELTERTEAMAKKILLVNDAPVRIGWRENLKAAPDLLQAALSEIHSLYQRSPSTVDFDLRCLKASVDYPAGPAVLPDEPLPLGVIVDNDRHFAQTVDVKLELPPGFSLVSGRAVQRLRLAPFEKVRLDYALQAPVSALTYTIRGKVTFDVDLSPAVESVPIALVGSYRWMVSPVFESENPFDDAFPPESQHHVSAVPEGWTAVSLPERDMEPERWFNGKPGALYMRHFIWSDRPRVAQIGIPTTGRMKLWLNGQFVHQTAGELPGFRPSGNGDGANYTQRWIKAGWNELLGKLVRGSEPIQAHFVLTLPHEDMNRGFAEAWQSRFPWE